MKNKVLHLCITLAVLNSLPHWGYAQPTDSILSVYFGAVRSGNHPAAPAEIFSADHYQSSLSLLGPYVDDSITIVSAKACEMVHSIASRASASEVRRGAVEMLLGAWRGQDIGINGMILEYLKQYSTEDFTGQARDSIRSLVRKEPVYFDRILKLAGFLQLDDLIPEIRPWTQPGNPTNLRWAAYLSLARMGDHAAIQDITERVKRLPVNDDVVYQIFPDLVYTRQQVLIALMVEALQNDARNCLTADPERDVPIPCGYRIMEQLAGIIAGYPFVRGESGDLNANDYPEALRQIRAWFLQHKTYTVLTDTY